MSDAAIADLIGSVDGDMGGIAVDVPAAGAAAGGAAAAAAAADGAEGGDVYDAVRRSSSVAFLMANKLSKERSIIDFTSTSSDRHGKRCTRSSPVPVGHR